MRGGNTQSPHGKIIDVSKGLGAPQAEVVHGCPRSPSIREVVLPELEGLKAPMLAARDALQDCIDDDEAILGTHMDRRNGPR